MCIRDSFQSLCRTSTTRNLPLAHACGRGSILGSCPDARGLQEYKHDAWRFLLASNPPLKAAVEMSATAPHAPAPSSSGTSSSSGSSMPAYLNTPYRTYQLWQRTEYPKQVWYFVSSAIGALVLCNLIYILRVRYRKNLLMKNVRAQMAVHDSEKSVGTNHTAASWRRLPLAIDTAFKIVAFRWTVPYGLNYVLPFSEVFLTVGYLAALMIWNFIYCKSFQLSIGIV